VDNLLQRVRLALADSYDIKAEVGRGGMAVVYRATDLRHERSVAVKVLPPHLASAVGYERFLHEIQVCAGLSHPYILPLLDSGQADGLLYYVMPFVEGENLRERLARETQLPVEDALRIACEMAEALSHAHSLEIIHRDVKPSNILLTREHALLADFGVAFALGRGADADKRLTGAGLAVGTPAYMSPQQGLADEHVDATSDQYSLACVIYEMLAGVSPFAAPSPDAVLRRHVMDTPLPIRLARPSVSAGVEEAIARALSKSPDVRFSSMEAFAAALQAPSARTSVVVMSPARRAGLVVAGGLFLAAAAVGLATLGDGPSLGGSVDESATYQLALLPCQAVASADSILGRDLSNDVFLRLTGVSVTPFGQSASWASDQVRRGLQMSDSVAQALEHLHASTLGVCVVRSVSGDSIDVDYQLSGRDANFRSETVRLPRLNESMADADRLIIELGNLLCDGSTSCGSSFRPTESTQAMDYYRKADDFFLHDQLGQAEVNFGMAAQVDPDFALARWRQADTRRWEAISGSENIDLPKLFMDQGNRLGTRDSLLLWALVEPPGPDAFEHFETVLKRLPNDAYAMLLYGDELLHRGPLWGVTLDSVESVLEASTRLNPSFAPAWDHLAQVRIRLGLEAEAEEAIERLEELASPRSATNRLPLAMIWRHGWRERFDPVAADTSRLKLQEDVNLLAVVARLVRYGDLPRGQLALGTALLQHAGTQSGDLFWHSAVNARGLALASLGRPDAASDEFSRAAYLTPAALLFADQWLVVPVALELEGFSETGVPEAVTRLERIANDPTAMDLHRARAAWSLAIHSPTTADFVRWVNVLESIPDADGHIRPLVQHLQAMALARQGRWSEAIDAGRSLMAYDSVGNTARPFVRAAVYLTRGSWFREVEEPDSAIASWTWHLNTDLEGVAVEGVQAGEVDGAFGTHARLRIARLAHQTEYAERACSEASEVVRRWTDPEESLTDALAEARRVVDARCLP